MGSRSSSGGDSAAPGLASAVSAGASSAPPMAGRGRRSGSCVRPVAQRRDGRREPHPMPDQTTRPKARRRGEITPKGPGRFLVRVFLGEDPITGRRVRLSQTVRGTRGDAEKLLTDLLSKQDRGASLPRSPMTLGAWLEEFETVWSTALGPQTRENAGQALRCYLPAGLLASRLTSVRAAHFQALYNGMTARGLAPATIGNLHRILKTRLGKAVELGHLAANPIDATAPPAIG